MQGSAPRVIPADIIELARGVRRDAGPSRPKTTTLRGFSTAVLTRADVSALPSDPSHHRPLDGVTSSILLSTILAVGSLPLDETPAASLPLADASTGVAELIAPHVALSGVTEHIRQQTWEVEEAAWVPSECHEVQPKFEATASYYEAALQLALSDGAPTLKPTAALECNSAALARLALADSASALNLFRRVMGSEEAAAAPVPPPQQRPTSPAEQQGNTVR